MPNNEAITFLDSESLSCQLNHNLDGAFIQLIQAGLKLAGQRQELFDSE